MEEEEWRNIYYYDYQISNFGNVRRLGCVKLRKLSVSTNGNIGVVLSKKNVSKHFSVCKLVAFAFLKNPDKKKYVIHNDGDNSNNNVSNLSWSDKK